MKFFKLLLLIKIIILFISISYNIYADENKTDNSDDILIQNDNTDDFSDLILEGDELVIYETQETTQQIKTITKDEIEKTNPVDLKSLLENLYHLNIKSYGTYGNKSTVNIRGLNGERILILIDGVPVNSKITGQVNLSLIPISKIEEIQVIKGGSDTKYNLSGAIGGVINIITKKKKESKLKLYSSISNLFYYPDFYYEKLEKNSDPDEEEEKNSLIGLIFLIPKS